MRKHTSFQIGGPADLFILPPSESALREIILLCNKEETPYFIMGKGSNLLISDEGIRGAVIRIGQDMAGMRVADGNIITCGAGASLSKLCSFALQHNLSGLEFAYGIPGSAGGAAYMNAGAYDGEMKDVLLSCSHIARTGEPGKLTGSDLNLGYRKSAYTNNKHIITSLTLRLTPGDAAGIESKMADLMERRKTKQPLEYPSAGSVFKRPPGHFAGALIERCGLKGCRIGGAEVSKRHAGFIINRGGATCRDILALVEKIQTEVYKNTGVSLECEIRSVGGTTPSC